MGEPANDNTASVPASSAGEDWYGPALFGSGPITTITLDLDWPRNVRFPMTPLRIRCCVPHCGRTKPNVDNHAEWICGLHWSGVPRERRRVWQRIVRAHRKGVPQDERKVERLWQRLKSIAIEKGMGL